jgi:hypothetical protein
MEYFNTAITFHPEEISYEAYIKIAAESHGHDHNDDHDHGHQH